MTSPSTSSTERLQKVIARSGFSSRRVADELIVAGRVTVDGAVARPGARVDPHTADIRIDGIPLPVRPDLAYYLVNKPAGVVSTAADTHGRPTVVDLVPAEVRVVPVGRLDMDSTGLLILTNDGALIQHLTHPSGEVPKTYVVLVDGTVSQATARALVSGVELDDGPAAALAARVLDASGGRSQLEVVMGEGRKREVRRMLEAVGHPVIELHRTAIGPLRDPRLKPGAWRRLTIDEVRSLWAGGSGAGPTRGTLPP